MMTSSIASGGAAPTSLPCRPTRCRSRRRQSGFRTPSTRHPAVVRTSCFTTLAMNDVNWVQEVVLRPSFVNLGLVLVLVVESPTAPGIFVRAPQGTTARCLVGVGLRDRASRRVSEPAANRHAGERCTLPSRRALVLAENDHRALRKHGRACPCAARTFVWKAGQFEPFTCGTTGVLAVARTSRRPPRLPRIEMVNRFALAGLARPLPEVVGSRRKPCRTTTRSPSPSDRGSCRPRGALRR